MQQAIRHAKASTGHDGTAKVTAMVGAHDGLETESDGKCATFRLVAAHHGISVDASVPMGELEPALELVRAKWSDHTVVCVNYET